MKYAIFGGAFDPVHNDHMNVAKALVELGIVDDVYLTPCYDHKHGKKMLVADERYKMVVLACEEHREIHANRYEILLKHNGSLYEFILKLPPLPAGVEQPYYVIGLDNAYDIKSWHEYEKLLQIAKFIVVRRAGVPIRHEAPIIPFVGHGGAPFPTYHDKFEHQWFLREPHIYLDLSDRVSACSSTHVRNIIKKEGVQSKKLKGLLPQVVLNQIIKNQFYVE